MAVGSLQNTISSSDISEEATYHVGDVISEYNVGDVISEYRIVKKYYKCNQEIRLKTQIIATYPSNKQCKSRQSQFQNCNGNRLIRYCFSDE